MTKTSPSKPNEPGEEIDEDIAAKPLPAGQKNYMTPAGHARLFGELQWLVQKERPNVTATVSWAAKNGDRSENGDYIYGKKRLREIDRRIRFLTKRLDKAEIVDPTLPREDSSKVFFGATVTYIDQTDIETTVSIVGIDEINPSKNYISWISPVARALMGAQINDVISLQTPGGISELEIISVEYQPIQIDAFNPDD